MISAGRAAVVFVVDFEGRKLPECCFRPTRAKGLQARARSGF
jgi:hypothetical protein